MFFVFAATLYAQKYPKIDLSFLKGQNELNIIFDYSNMSFIFEDNMPEERYVEKQTITEGEKWKLEWETTKDSIRAGCKHKNFFKDFNLALFDDEYKLRGGNFLNAEYTMIVKISVIRVGQIVSHSPYIVANIFFVETNSDNKSDEIQIVAEGNPFSGMLGRIESAYESLGKSLAQLIMKRM